MLASQSIHEDEEIGSLRNTEHKQKASAFGAFFLVGVILAACRLIVTWSCTQLP